MPRINAKNRNKNIIVNEIRIQSVDRTIKHIGNLIQALKSAESVHYPNRSQLYDLYAHVEMDPFLTGIKNKRIDAVLNKEICFYKDDVEVEGMSDFLKSEVFYDICKHILEVKFYGVSGMEFIPGAEVEFEPIPRKHLKPEFYQITLDQTSHDGISYENNSNIWVVGKKRDYGLFLQCAPYSLYKKGDFGDWAQFVEIFGQPMRIAKYDAGDLKTKEQLSSVLAETGSSLSLMIPKQAEFELMDGKTSNADGQLQERLKDACNNEMAVVILGNTETTSNSNGGSNAKAKEHGKQQLVFTKSDMRYLLTQLNSKTFIRILDSYNLPVAGGSFKFEADIDLDALNVRKDIDLAISEKVPVEDDYFYGTYHIPKPKNYDKLRAEMDERKQGPLLPEAQDPEDGPLPVKKPSNKPPTKPQPSRKPVDNLTVWQSFRAWMSNFFDPAHTD